jgi:hypothetical protein
MAQVRPRRRTQLRTTVTDEPRLREIATDRASCCATSTAGSILAPLASGWRRSPTRAQRPMTGSASFAARRRKTQASAVVGLGVPGYRWTVPISVPGLMSASRSS